MSIDWIAEATTSHAVVSANRTTCIVPQAAKKNKSKSKDRSGMEGRANGAVARASANAQIVSVELSLAEIERLRTAWFESDEIFKRALVEAGLSGMKEWVSRCDV
nr:hypothetical protein HK105_004811 [Polyrhizophydium stewartii]